MAEPPLLRVSQRARGGEQAEEALRARMLELWPDGVEEERDDDGLVVAAYARSPLQLPEGGPWLIEAVEDGWEHRWREHHHGRRIADRLWVGPPWEAPAAGLEPVVIDPGQAFGTGSHPTTLGCLELLCRLEPVGPLLDLGCGSGVLAIAAARLGFGPVLACDSDPLAVAASQENAARNGVALDVSLADALRDPLPAAALWVANILREPLLSLLARADVPPRAIVSGLLAAEPFAPAGWHELDRCERDGWLALLLERS